MKKFILLAAISSTFIMCKKGDAGQSQFEEAIHAADSTTTIAAEAVKSVNSSANKVLDSANIKIKEFENTKDSIKEKIETVSKNIDSLSDKIASVKLESVPEKKDSAEKKPGKAVANTLPKIIKETKIIYRGKHENNTYEFIAPKNKMIKTGTLELTVNDTEAAKEIVKGEVKKYDGFVKSENISLNNDKKKTAYLKIKVPIQKFEYLMDDLSNNIGKIENKGIEVSGQDFIENTMCELEVTLYGTADGYAENNKPVTFGEKSFAAISSGWNVITSIFLFILPLWPLFLIAGIGYYFYKRKKAQNTSGNSSQNN